MPHPRRKAHARKSGGMEVLSIADFDRLQQMQADSFLESAVDQLEHLAAPARPDGKATTPDVLADIVVHFGELRVEESSHLRFGFEPPTSCRQWPGPSFGFMSLHKELIKPASPQTSKKHHRSEDLRQSPRPRKASKPKRKARPIVCYSAMSSHVKSRDPPLTLMTLPPEIRNTIWGLLAVYKDPIDAQLRQIMPCKKLTRLRGKIIRRFPREPVIAAVNHQLRKEVLSIFYGTNHFIFEAKAGGKPSMNNMTSPTMIHKWQPNMAHYLGHIDLRFNTRRRLAEPPRASESLSIVYDLRSLSNGEVRVELKLIRTDGTMSAQASHICLCDEMEIVSSTGVVACNLTDLAISLVRKRNQAMFATQQDYYRPRELVCSNCGKETLEIVYSGV